MKIAIAVDGSENALRAAKHAILLAQHLPDAHLEVIHVVDYSKAKDEHLLAQNPEGLALKREQKIHPVRELAESAHVDMQLTILKGRSEEHTSELQSRFDLVCRLLL